MLKRSKNVYIKKLLYKKNYTNFLHKKLLNSYKQNYNIYYLKRLSFFINKYSVNSEKNFYNSQNKLFCNISYSSKVPSRKVYHSRFYLNKVSNSLILFNYHK